LFEKILIANRGEIALRVMRACREMGIGTVAIYSEADRDSLHVRFADEAYCVGPAPSARSYLNIPNILSTALLAGVDAIHPGYGYLAERAHFAEICETHGLKFIGPRPNSIEQAGDKVLAKKTMKQAGVPVIPGSDGSITDEATALAVAEKVGYPVLVKAASGGGGKGMRIATNPQELIKVISIASQEAEKAFANAEVYIEKFIEEPRHIEMQIIADEYGNTVYLGERECSVQRRYQKLIEESPAPGVSEATRQAMGEAAVLAAKAVNYASVGTVEFLLDQSGQFYFMEMNTRIQVEHPVTEAVTGIDLVKEQIRIAAGEELGYTQEDIALSGHAIECRINAEDPDRDFFPSPGKIIFYHEPGGLGVRVDSSAYAGYTVSPYYDPMFGKLICHAPDRDEAIARMNSALREFTVEGIKTTIPFHLKVLANKDFQLGNITTNFIERHILTKR
jgi:acetyl-CoA carboxylase biotin carboxylase subunit